MLKLTGISKSFQGANDTSLVLDNINLCLGVGEVKALTGASGSGKSTLLHIIGLISTPDSGEITIDGKSCAFLDDNERSAARRKLGFIYQFHHLLGEFSSLDNLIIPQIVAGEKKKDAEMKAMELLEKFNLGHLQDKKPHQMSGGENQRISILRALAKSPVLLLADEPTGNLDARNAEDLFNFLVQNAHDFGIATLIVTHNKVLASKCDSIVDMEDL